MDEKVIIGKGTKYPLDGILSLPENLSKKVPAVVFFIFCINLIISK